MGKAIIHFMVDDDKAQIPFQRPNFETKDTDTGFHRPACKGPKSTMPKHATNEADSVTCDACKATPEWKQAMADLLTEREVPTTDPQWKGLPLPTPEHAETAAAVPTASPVAAAPVAQAAATTEVKKG